MSSYRHTVQRFCGAFLLSALLGVLLLGVLPALTPPAEGAPARVEVLSLKPVPLVEQGFEESATLEAKEEVTLYAKVSGRLEELFKAKGEAVTKGETIVRLDHREKDAKIRSAQAQVLVGNAQLAQAQAELENAAMEQSRYERLFKEGYATQQQLDSKKTLYRTAKAQVDLAQAQLRASRAEVEALRVDLSEYTLKAPFSGVILEDYDQSRGNMITPSNPVVRLGDTDILKAVVRAPESRVSRIIPGMPAKITVRGMENTSFEGTVQFVSPFVDSDTRTTRIEVQVDNAATGHRLRPGMFVQVLFVEHRLENPLMIPADAVTQRNGDFLVFTVQDGKAFQQKVTPGVRHGENLQILDGLAPGDLLIIRGGRNLNSGDEVQHDPIS
jgi:membrane fusion protein (multidrug efflux system)